ncbi:hypothetical protein BGZ63DRAFT_419656 [Mariannaea sp. PMI_226]|nr:hypothetical protein BGZ63DRAFT_419656 [Mariannaea sp. PMI_226]
MKTFLSASSFTLLASLATSVVAQAEGVYCKVSHESNGNTFKIGIFDVPSISTSTICGHFNDQLTSDSGRNNVNIANSLQCETPTSSYMDFSVTLDKQPPQAQLEVIVGALTEAFGSQGVNFDRTLCDLSQIPT